MTDKEVIEGFESDQLLTVTVFTPKERELIKLIMIRILENRGCTLPLLGFYDGWFKEKDLIS